MIRKSPINYNECRPETPIGEDSLRRIQNTTLLQHFIELCNARLSPAKRATQQ